VLHPKPSWGAYSVPPDPLVVSKVSTSKRREGKDEERGKEEDRKENGGEGRERRGSEGAVKSVKPRAPKVVSPALSLGNAVLRTQSNFLRV